MYCMTEMNIKYTVDIHLDGNVSLYSSNCELRHKRNGRVPRVANGRDPRVANGRDPRVANGRDPRVANGRDPRVARYEIFSTNEKRSRGFSSIRNVCKYFMGFGLRKLIFLFER